MIHIKHGKSLKHSSTTPRWTGLVVSYPALSITPPWNWPMFLLMVACSNPERLIVSSKYLLESTLDGGCVERSRHWWFCASRPPVSSQGWIVVIFNLLPFNCNDLLVIGMYTHHFCLWGIDVEPCGAGSAVPREGFDLSVIILASLLVFPMLGCRHSLLRL